MIPKKIHYCWFGGNKLPDSAKKCINSWKKFFPNYEIIEWNESNFDIGFNKYAKEAYESGKYAFFTDVARLYIIYKYGGIYFDVDVEVIKPFDNILNDKAFFGLESSGKMATGLGFGAEKGCKLIKEMLDDYDNRAFLINGKMDLTPCPIRNSKILINNGFTLNNENQTINGITVYSSDFFNPKSGYGLDLNLTENTVSIHYFDGSWLSNEAKRRSKIYSRLKKKYGKFLAKLLFNSIYLPYRFFSKIKENI